MKKSINMKHIMLAYDDMNTYYYGPDKETVMNERKQAYEALLEPLTAEIRKVEEGKKVRKITAENIVDILLSVEAHLDISKTAMNGICICADYHAQKFPNRYKGIPESTQFRAVYKNGSWRIEDIFRTSVRYPTRGVEIILTETAKEAVVKRAQYMPM